jgi:hypothetical protein
VAVATADGDVRVAVAGRISTGSIYRDDADGIAGTLRSVGFAVDAAGGRAYVVDPDLVVAEVDLGSLEVTYHGPLNYDRPVRTLAKALDGPIRYAEWLGDGLIAVAGADYATTGTGLARKTTVTPYGVRVLDTRTWEARTLDPKGEWFQRAPGVLLVETPAPGNARTVTAWGYDGRVQYTLKVPPQGYIDVEGVRAYVCRNDRLVRVVSTATGATLAAPHVRPCVELLDSSATP